MGHRRRLPVVLAAALGLAAFQIVGAGPAAADHTVDVSVDGSSCVKGTPALGIPVLLRTDRAVVRTLRDGTIVTKCHFRGLPDRVVHEDFGPWVRPSEATRISWPANCSLVGEGLELVFGHAEALVTPAGTLKVTCTFTPQPEPPDASLPAVGP